MKISKQQAFIIIVLLAAFLFAGTNLFSITSSSFTMLNITTEPAGATLKLYAFCGSAPCTSPSLQATTPLSQNVFNQRQYKIVLEKEGYQKQETVIYIPPFDQINYSYKLSSVNANPTNFELAEGITDFSIEEGQEKTINIKIKNTGQTGTGTIAIAQENSAGDTISTQIIYNGNIIQSNKIIENIGENQSIQFDLLIKALASVENKKINVVLEKQNDVSVNKILGSWAVTVTEKPLPPVQTNSDMYLIFSAIIIMSLLYIYFKGGKL